MCDAIYLIPHNYLGLYLTSCSVFVFYHFYITFNFNTHYVLFNTHYVLFNTYYVLFNTHYVLFNTYNVLFNTHYVLF